MSTSDNQDTTQDEDAPPVIHVDIRLTRRIGTLPPMAMQLWQGFKGVLFLLSLVGIMFVTLRPETEVHEALRYTMCFMVLWQVWDKLVARHRYGVSHILVTTKGVCFTDDNIYVRWEDIESWKNDGRLLRMRPKPGHGPKGFLAPKECDIPLTENNREFLLDLFRERVSRWRPE